MHEHAVDLSHARLSRPAGIHRNLPPAQLVEIILSTGYIDHVAHDAPREERMAVAEREKQLRALPADQLLKIATERALEPA